MLRKSLRARRIQPRVSRRGRPCRPPYAPAVVPRRSGLYPPVKTGLAARFSLLLLGGSHLGRHFGCEVVDLLLDALAHHVHGERSSRSRRWPISAWLRRSACHSSRTPGSAVTLLSGTWLTPNRRCAWRRSPSDCGCLPSASGLVRVFLGLQLGDRTLFLDQLGRHLRPTTAQTGFIAAMCIATSLPTCSSAPLVLDDHADAGAVQVRGQLVGGLEALEAAHGHILADFADQRGAHVVEGLAVGARQGGQRGHVGRIVFGDQLGGQVDTGPGSRRSWRRSRFRCSLRPARRRRRAT